MIAGSNTSRLKILDDFRNISPDNFNAVIRFFENHRKEIQSMDVEAYFEFVAGYADAVFEIGGKSRFLNLADELIEISITHNIIEFRGEDIYQKLLLRKAVCLYGLNDLDQSIRITKELIKINPKSDLYAHFYRSLLHKKPPLYVNKVLGIGMVLCAIAGFVLAIEFLFGTLFFSAYLDQFMILKWGLLIGTLGLLLGTYLLFKFSVYFNVAKYIRFASKRKKKKPTYIN